MFFKTKLDSRLEKLENEVASVTPSTITPRKEELIRSLVSKLHKILDLVVDEGEIKYDSDVARFCPVGAKYSFSMVNIDGNMYFDYKDSVGKEFINLVKSKEDFAAFLELA
jgi:hypothetical protein